ncbi:MAG: protein kinase domain-containing protein, partial [Myxococcota bacterium]
GAVLLLENGGELKFQLRCFESAPQHPTSKAVRLVLDGQQRLTSLYLALRSGRPVPTYVEDRRKLDVQRIYYFDLRAWFDAEVDKRDAILSLPPERVIRTNFNRDVVRDLSSVVREYDEHCIPVSSAFADALSWGMNYMEHHGYSPLARDTWKRFADGACANLQKYQVPFIQLEKGTSRAAVCAVFEKVNQGGKPLDIFELVTATFAGEEEGFRLAHEWEQINTRLAKSSPLLSEVKSTDFLQAVTLVAAYHQRNSSKPRRVGCRREEMLVLPLSDWKTYAGSVEEGFRACARLLDRERIYEPKWLPYPNQLIPMAAIAAVLGNCATEEPTQNLIMRWFWSGVFGELYSGTTETRYGRDIMEVPEWINSGPEPKTVRDCAFTPSRLLRLTTRNAAAYKAVMALYLQLGSRDFCRGDELDRTFWFAQKGYDDIDVHHIFPTSWCERAKVSHSDSILNKTPLSARTHKSLGGRAPSQYLDTLENRGIHRNTLNNWLASHCIPIQEIRSDDYAGFIRERARMILDRIELKTGKPVVGRDSEATKRDFGGDLLHREPPRAPEILFDDLEVEKVITGGGMAETFLVQSPTYGRAFLKRARIDTDNARALQREQGIYERLSRMNVEGVLKVFDFRRDETHVGLLLERAEGNLTNWVANRHHVRMSDIRLIAQQILEGLQNLHALEIVHRDLKPDNVMYLRTAEGETIWKLADFGIAKHTPRWHTRYTFQQHGTPGYMSPEQRNGAEAAPSADVYSFGKVICWLLTGGTDPDAIVAPLWQKFVNECVQENDQARSSLADLHAHLLTIPT